MIKDKTAVNRGFFAGAEVPDSFAVTKSLAVIVRDFLFPVLHYLLWREIMTNSRTRRIKGIASAGIFSALAIVLVIFIRFPIFPAVAFLEYDPADVTIFLMTALLGPWYGLGMTVAVSIIQGLTVSSLSGWVGIFMHIAATGSFVAAESVVFFIIKKRHIHKKTVSAGIYSIPETIAAMGCGVVGMISVMALWNLLLTPYFMGVSLEMVLSLYPYIIGFNLIKSLINGTLSVVIYNSMKRVFTRFLN